MRNKIPTENSTQHECVALHVTREKSAFFWDYLNILASAMKYHLANLLLKRQIDANSAAIRKCMKN